MFSTTSSCSSQISPTSSSRMSSIVTMPTTPPYSSITTAMWFFVRCSSFNSTASLVEGTTHKGSDIISLRGTLPLRR